MIKRWVTPSGIAVAYRVPSTTLEVVTGQRFLMPFTVETASGASLASLLGWVAPYVERLEGVEWSRLDELDRSDALDLTLDPVDLVSLAETIITSAMLPADEVDAARAYIGFVWGGVCECRACKGLAESDPMCLRVAHPRTTQVLVNNWWPLRESDTAHAPYWTHQLRLLHDAALAAVREEERRKQERRNAWREKLGKRGLM